MFTVLNFTDPQGATHTEAIFQVQQATLRIDSTDDYNMDVINPAAQAITTINGRKRLSYHMCFWRSQEDKDEGLPPYTLLNKKFVPVFSFDYTNNTDYDGLAAEQAAEKHCKEVELV